MKAVIIGGGIAGLACAKAISKHYHEIVIYDGGTQPQGQHLHALLKKGQETLESLFPGALKKIAALQAPTIDWALDTHWTNKDGFFPKYESQIKNLSMSHHSIRNVMYQDLRSLKNIAFKNELLRDFSHLDADLIIVSSGAKTDMRRWIKKETIVPIDLTYRSYLFHKSELNLNGFKQYYFQINPPDSLIGAVICPIENDLMVATIIEHQKDYVSLTSFTDFKVLAAKIPDKTFLKILGHASPISKLAVFRKTKSYRRSINPKSVNQNIIFVGDCLTSLNPVFGQGMTVSLLQAQHLKECLNKKRDFKKIQENLENITKSPFLLSKLGSQQSGFGKSILNHFLKLCQKFKSLHHFFLHRLHNP